MTIYVTDDFKQHVPDWESHVRGDILWTEYGEGWLDGYECGERKQAGPLRELWTAVADALGHWQADGRTEGLVTRIRSALADAPDNAALAAKEPAP